MQSVHGRHAGSKLDLFIIFMNVNFHEWDAIPKSYTPEF